MKNKEIKVRRLSRFSLATLIAVYFLILVGGIVRSTGSGMGCPDWPKCFDQWVPPTSASELPEDYKTIYSNKRQAKNERFATYLSALGFEETADKILTDESIKEEADFNKYKTWTEYINRLIGVLIGLFIIVTFWYSIPFLKTNKTIFFVALSTLILVIFQGWIGSIVVSTNLVPWMITIHMFIAMAIVALLVYLVFKTHPKWSIKKDNVGIAPFVVIACMVLMLIQIALGTQVRESVDIVSQAMPAASRSTWVENLDVVFLIHRSFSWIVIFAHALLLYVLFKKHIKSKTLYYLLGVIILSIFTGVILNYFGLPKAIQPAHLLLGTMAFGMQFLLFLQLKRNKSKLSELVA